MNNRNLLSYSSVERPWYSRSVQNPTLNSIVTSILVTFISYQAAALVFDLVLGVKKKRSAKVKTLGILMLTWKSSCPLAVFNSVLRKDWITRMYFKGDLPRETKISRDANGVRLVTVVMLFVLLIVAPVMDTVFITLTLSRTADLSFSEAGFDGIRHGLHENLEVLDTVPFMTSCRLVKFDSRRNDFIDAKLSLCLSPVLPQPVQGNPTGFEVEVRSESEIRMNVIVRGNAAVSANFAGLQTKEGSFQVRAGLTSESVKPLTAMALELLRKECGEITEIGALPATGDGTVVASVQVRCEKDSTTERPLQQSPEMIITEALRLKFTLVPWEDLIVVSSASEAKFVDASEFHFLQRRERNASTLTLVLVTLAILLVRAILGFFLSNDVADCLEYVVKDGLGFNRCASLFWAGPERVHFRKKFQEGEIAQFGLHRECMREVEKFTGGTVGGYERLSFKT